MTQSSESAESRAVRARLAADHAWLASQGVEVSQFGPDPISGKVRVYLARYSEAAEQVLIERYGTAIVVDTESRRWRFT